MKLKICGVNDAAFARRARDLGADYIGLIFADGSPRRVSVEQARDILADLREPGDESMNRQIDESTIFKGTVPVGVFTRRPVAEVIAIARELSLTHVQLHWRAGTDEVLAAKSTGLVVWTLAGGSDLADAYLYDSSHGDGDTVFCRGLKTSILAGGISEANLAAAIALGPDVIDVSGSLESSKGVKSIAKLESFIAAYRAAVQAI